MSRIARTEIDDFAEGAGKGHLPYTRHCCYHQHHYQPYLISHVLTHPLISRSCRLGQDLINWKRNVQVCALNLKQYLL
jgi:hypothetical protein